MLEVAEKGHSTICPCDKCTMHDICKLEEFITYNLDTKEIPRGLRISCDYYDNIPQKGYNQRD